MQKIKAIVEKVKGVKVLLVCESEKLKPGMKVVIHVWKKKNTLSEQPLLVIFIVSYPGRWLERTWSLFPGGITSEFKGTFLI